MATVLFGGTTNDQILDDGSEHEIRASPLSSSEDRLSMSCLAFVGVPDRSSLESQTWWGMPIFVETPGFAHATENGLSKPFRAAEKHGLPHRIVDLIPWVASHQPTNLILALKHFLGLPTWTDPTVPYATSTVLKLRTEDETTSVTLGAASFSLLECIPHFPWATRPLPRWPSPWPTPAFPHKGGDA